MDDSRSTVTAQAVREIPLTQGLVALVDEADYARLAAHKWCAQRVKYTAYAVRHRMYRCILMHREVLEITDTGLRVDHRNRNGLDNTRNNLRIATRSQNAVNCSPKLEHKTSRFRGVHWRSSRERWRAAIRADGRGFTLGAFLDEVEAARAYDRAAILHHGEFAVLNFPREEYRS